MSSIKVNNEFDDCDEINGRECEKMQMCGNCMKVYDESEYAKCPFCCNDKDEYTHVIVFDKDAGVAKSVPKKDAHLYE